MKKTRNLFINLTGMILLSVNTLLCQCNLLQLMVDPCGDDSSGEYVLFETENNLDAANISFLVDCPNGTNNYTVSFGSANHNGFVNSLNDQMQAQCGSGIFVDGTGLTIPAGSVVLAYLMPNPEISDYATLDFSPFCCKENVYLIFGDAFEAILKNNDGCTACGCVRYIDLIVDGCLAEINYDLTLLSGGDGSYVLPGSNPTDPAQNLYLDGSGCLPVTNFIGSGSGPDASISLASGNGTICVGECLQIDVTITGGVPLYDLTLNINVSGIFDFDFTVPALEINDSFTICLEEGGLFPSFDPGTNTLTLPELAVGFSGSLTLTGIVDDTGCTGTVDPTPLNISFVDRPEANPAGPLTVCDLDNDGSEDFDLTSLNSTIGGSDEVLWFEDFDLMNEISGPSTFTANVGTTLVYAVVNTDCYSDPEPIELIVDEPEPSEFAPIDPLCFNDPVLTLPTTSDNSIMGTWIPATIDPSSGTSVTAIFTPDMGFCALPQSITVEVEVLTVEADYNGPICDGDDLQLFGMPDDAAAYLWSGPVSFNAGEQNPVLTNVALDNAGNYTLTVIEGACTVSDMVNVEIVSLPSYNVIETGCDNGFYFVEILVINGDMVASDLGDVNDSGNNIFVIDNIPSEEDVSITITLGTDPFCQFTDIFPAPDCGCLNPASAFAGMDTTICAGTVITLEGQVTGVNNGSWTTSGTGSFSDNNVLNAVYTPSPEDEDNGSVIITLTSDDPDGEDPLCSAAVDEFTLTILQGPNAGVSTDTVFCSGGNTVLNFMASLGSMAEEGGMWSDVSGSSVDLSDSTMVDISNLNEGAFIFEYTVENICGIASSELIVEIVNASEAGADTSIFYCINETETFDFTDLLSSEADTNGVFIDTSGAIDFSDPALVNLNNLAQDTFFFIYIVEGNGPCDPDSAWMSVNILNNNNAGEDAEINTCDGTIVDLNDIINGTSGGAYYNTNNPTIEVFNIVNTNNLGGNTFSYYYIVQSSSQCTPDTAELTVNVVDMVSAGEDNTISTCTGDSIDLQLYLVDASPGGIFVDKSNSQSLPASFFTPVNDVNPLTYEFYYIVGDGISCPIDTALITVTNTSPPVLSLTPQLSEICSGNCTVLNLDYTIQEPYFAFFTLSDAAGNTFVNSLILDVGDILAFEICNLADGAEDFFNLEPEDQYVLTLDSLSNVNDPECTFYYDTIQVEIITTDAVEYMLDSTICNQDIVIINGNIYDRETLTGTEILEGAAQGGCDSIIFVNLTVKEDGHNFIDMDLCDGGSFSINGVIFDEDNPAGSLDYPNAAANGCDSVIFVQLNFLGPIDSTYMASFCPEADVMIGDSIFNIDNTSGTVLLPDYTEEGCDVLIMVDLEFSGSDPELITGVLCDGESVQIGSTTYDQNNLSGQEILPMAAQGGCDSIINVMFTAGQITEEDFVFNTCDENEVFTVNGINYNIDNPSGQEILEGVNQYGCDSIINVAVSYSMLDAEVSGLSPTCLQPDGGRIVVNFVLSNSPPFYFLIGNDTLPIDNLPFIYPVTEGDYDVTILDTDGCESDFQFTIEPAIIPQSTIIQTMISEGEYQLELIYNVTPESIVWSPSEGLSCTDCTNPIASPESTTTYTADISYGDDCPPEQLTIQIAIEDPSTVKMPNIFSPGNDDNINNIFFPVSTATEACLVKRMLIFDRWGNLMFDRQDFFTNDETQGWDGTFKNQLVDPGVYVYFIEMESADGEMERLVGDVTVLR